MVFKYNFSVSGDNFYPETILNNIQGNFIVDSYFNPTDKKFDNKPDEYGNGNLSFWHKNKLSTEVEIAKYEGDFVEFIEKNHLLFVENGVSELAIFLEIYFDGGQCNFEVFNKQLLKRIGDLRVTLPISVYLLKNEQIQK